MSKKTVILSVIKELSEQQKRLRQDIQLCYRFRKLKSLVSFLPALNSELRTNKTILSWLHGELDVIDGRSPKNMSRARFIPKGETIETYITKGQTFEDISYIKSILDIIEKEVN